MTLQHDPHEARGQWRRWALVASLVLTAIAGYGLAMLIKGH